MNMFIMHELQLKNESALTIDFEIHLKILKGMHVFMFLLHWRKVSPYGKRILYVIYRYFQITHLIIKNKFFQINKMAKCSKGV